MTARLKFPPTAVFRALWEGMPADTVVAQNWSDIDCPLAKGLTALLAIEAPSVFPWNGGTWFLPWDGGTWFNGIRRRKLPIWATIFARKIDEGLNLRSITAAQCLAVLDAIEGRGTS